MDYLSSRIGIREEPPKTRPITGVPTSILAAAGVTERGPHPVTLVTSFEEFLKLYGGDTVNSDLCPAMRAFFDEGGTRAWIKRVVHYDTPPGTGVTSAKGSVVLQSAAGAPGAGSVAGTVAGPWDLSAGDFLDILVDTGGSQQAVFDAVAGTVTGGVEPYVLSNGMTLLMEIDNGAEQTVTFLTSEFVAIGAATALEVAAVVNAKLVGINADVTGSDEIRITSDTKGTGSRVKCTGGTAATALGLAAADNTGTGDVANIDAVTFAEARDLIEADITTPSVTCTEDTGGYLRITSDAPGATSKVHVEATSTADDEFGLDNAAHMGDSGAAANALDVEGKTDGSYTDGIRIIISDATSGETDEFNLQVEHDGIIVETFSNLTMTSTTAERYAKDIVNHADTGSNLIAVDDPTPALNKRPANGTSAYLTGGDDGLSTPDLVVADFIGNTTDDNGLRGFDSVEEVNLLIVPGQANKDVQTEMLTYCESTRRGSMFAVLDPPSDQTAAEMVTYLTGAPTLYNLSEYGAIYYPLVKVINPDRSVYGDVDTITVYPCGHIAGVYARNDLARPGGVYDPPAGVERGVFRTVVGYESEETKHETKRDLLYPKRINPLSIIAGKLAIDGVRTLRGDSNFPTVAERRGVIFIEYSLKNGLEFARYYFNDPDLRAQVRRTITLFLLQQLKRRAFRSKVPAQAFLVDVSDALNPDSVAFAGRMVVKVSLATQKPAEFIDLIFSQDTRALDTETAAAGA